MRLDTSAYYAIGIPLFALATAVEAVVGRRRGVKVYRLADDLGSLACGMGQLLAGIFLGPLMLALYAVGYDLRVVTLPRSSLLTWALSIVLVDLCYYFYHRAGHNLAVLYAVHGVHHQSDDVNFAVALRQPYFSDLYAIFFYFPLPLLGVPEEIFFASVAVLSLNQVTLHTRVFSRRSFWLFNTPELHLLHHAKNAPYLGCNFGASLIVWDKLFGTFRAPDPNVVPVLGAPEGYATHDGVAAQWLGVVDLARRARAATGLRAMLRVLFSPPKTEPYAGPRAPASEDVPRGTAIRATALFIVTTSLSTLVLWRRADFAAWELAMAIAVLLVAYRAVGRTFDRARERESRLRGQDRRDGGAMSTQSRDLA